MIVMFMFDTFPPLSLLTFSHHSGILSWWEYAGSHDDDDVGVDVDVVDDDVDADGVDVDDAGCQPEVLSATRHAQHDEPGQTHARQPENHCIVIILIIFLPLN